MPWPDPKDELPEGTDTVIAGASTTENEEALIVREPTARDKALDKIKTGTDKLSGQAADKARGLVGQGLERGGEALANVSKLVGDTAAGLDERLGEEYGEYARQARRRDRGCRQPHRRQGSRRADRRHPRIRPQEPGRGPGRRGDHRLRAGPAGQDRASTSDKDDEELAMANGGDERRMKSRSASCSGS